MGALSVGAAASRCHSPSGCMQWDRKYKTYTHTSFSIITRLFADTSSRFNRDGLSKCYKRSSTDTPDRVEPQDIKLRLIFASQSSTRWYRTHK